MAELQPNDELLVNRDNVTYTQEQGTIMANLQGDDYLLINRDDATYKITGQDFIDSVVDPLELTVVLDNTTPAPGDTINAIASPAGGKQPYTAITYQWKQRADDGQVTDIASATRSSLSITAEMAGFEIACEATVGDSLGSSVTTLSDYTDAVAYQEEVDTPELITPPDGAGLGAGISPESGVITDVSVEGPNATMYGLRFDPNRETRLRSSRNVKDVKVCTISAWIKPTSNTSNFTIFDPTVNGTSTYFAYRPATDTVDLLEGSTVLHGVPASGILNKWTHVVLSSDGTDVKISVNGVTTTKTVSFTWRENGTFIPSGRPANSLSADGYMSDYYFVDGQALEPEVFGKSSVILVSGDRWTAAMSTPTSNELNHPKTPARTTTRSGVRL